MDDEGWVYTIVIIKQYNYLKKEHPVCNQTSLPPWGGLGWAYYE